MSVCDTKIGFHVDYLNMLGVSYPPYPLPYLLILLSKPPSPLVSFPILYHLYIHIKGFNWSYPIQRIMLIPEVIGCQIKSPVPGVGDYALSCWLGVSYGHPLNKEATATEFGCPPEL